MKSPEIKYPVREWLGRFESHTLKRYGRKRYRFVDYYIERFLGHFPTHSGLEQFTTADVQDFIVWQKKAAVSDRAIRFSLWSVKEMWEYAISQGCVLWNPAAIVERVYQRVNRPRLPMGTVKYINRLGHEDFRRLYEAARYQQLRTWLLSLIDGKPVKVYYPMVSHHLKKAALASGLPYIKRIAQLKAIVERSLWRKTFLQNIYPQLHDALLQEIQVYRSSAAYIKATSRDVRPTVEDADNGATAVAGVDELQCRPELEGARSSDMSTSIKANAASCNA